MKQFDVEWVDGGREPKNAPNPEYPNGIDLDMSRGIHPACTTELPYPAKRCGHYSVRCLVCGMMFAVTTAGRPDDPRSVKIECPLGGKTVQ